MEEYTLEDELNFYINKHRKNTLKADITRHYTDLYKTGVQIPEFMVDKTPTQMAEESLVSVVANNNSLTLRKLYEEAYQRNVKFIKGWGERA
jgi:hypothetical protein